MSQFNSAKKVSTAVISEKIVTLGYVACENIRFSSLFAAGDVSRGGTSATQQQKFHTDDENQCLHNKSGSLMVDFGKVLCSSANELPQNSNASSREDYILGHKY